jgi:hypothetical protein
MMAATGSLESLIQCLVEPLLEVIQALPRGLNSIQWAGEGGPGQCLIQPQPGHPQSMMETGAQSCGKGWNLAQAFHSLVQGLVEALPQVCEFPQQLGGGLGYCFGRGAGRGAAEVGYKVADGEVNLVADSTDHGDRASSNGAGEVLIVESPEILHGTTPAGNEQDIYRLEPRESLHTSGDL